jgi:F-type H+-transporting ATPase subunit epsilon
MEHTHRVTLMTPEKTLLDAAVVSIVAPGSEGFLGILANHAPLITALTPGPLTLTFPGGTKDVYALSGGFLEVSNNRTVVLADVAEKPGEIDLARAQAARDRARRRLSHWTPELDVARAEVALARAINRIRVASSGTGSQP